MREKRNVDREVIRMASDSKIQQELSATDTNVIKGGAIILDLSPRGGGKLRVSCNPNDNKIFLEGFNSEGKESAAEMRITGRGTLSLPVFTVSADITRFL